MSIEGDIEILLFANFFQPLDRDSSLNEKGGRNFHLEIYRFSKFYFPFILPREEGGDDYISSRSGII